MASEAEQAFRSMTRLVPNSGIQFIDVQIPWHIVDGVTRRFAQESVRIGDETVWGLAPIRPTPPDQKNPSHKIDPATDLEVDGRTAVKAVLNQWVPLPLLRFIARDGEGRMRFDDGPYNWARLYLSDDDSNGSTIRGVIALDTQIEPASRMDVQSYACPTLDDVRFGSTFALSDDADQLAAFLAEDWLQGWVQALFEGIKTPRRTGASAAAGLQQMAAYLTLITVLRRAAQLPSLQFFDLRPGIVSPVPVDLVIDIGASRGCALLVESATEHGRPVIANSVMLELRDLSQPTKRHRGSFDSRLAFARPNFGNEAFSRKSGRVAAFNWPSLARTGPEATRLSSTSKAADGATGMASPKNHLLDLALRDETWRFAAEASTRTRRSHMIAGRMLSHVDPTTSLLTGPEGSVRQVALRPRFSLSSMMSFMIAEVVLQALASVNAPAIASDSPRDQSARGEGVRQLRQIVVCAPLTMPLEERDLLRERAEAAIDMLWRALDWDHQQTELVPARPVVRLGLDETLSAQLVFLYDEIAQRFGGETRAFLDIMGKSRPEFGVQPCIRLGALDIGGGHASMTIVTYASSGDAPIGPKLLGAQRSGIGCDVVLDRVIADLIWPAIVRSLKVAGVPDADVFLARHASIPDGNYDVASLPQRMQDYWLRPAALALVKLATGLTAHAAPANLTFALCDLAATPTAPNPHVAEELTTLAHVAGAHDFDLGDVRVVLRLDQVSTAAKSALAPMIANLSRAIVASDCDVVLLTGWAARQKIVKDLLLEAMPWRPNRIITLHDRDWQDWYPMSEADRAAADGKDIGLIGALLALAGGERLGFGSGESGFPFAPGTFSSDAAETATDETWRSASTGRGGRA